MTLRYPKDDLDAEDVEAAMEAVIEADVFASGLTDALAAQIIGRTVTDLFKN
jgi:hypothetical protein